MGHGSFGDSLRNNFVLTSHQSATVSSTATLRTPASGAAAALARTRSGASHTTGDDSRDNSMQRLSSAATEDDETHLMNASTPQSPDPAHQLSPLGRKGGNLLNHNHNTGGHGNGKSYVAMAVMSASPDTMAMNNSDASSIITPSSPKTTSIPATVFTGSPVAGVHAGFPQRPMSNSPITLSQKQRLAAAAANSNNNINDNNPNVRDRSPLLVSSSVTRLSHHGSHGSNHGGGGGHNGSNGNMGNGSNGHNSNNGTTTGDDSDHTPQPSAVVIRSPHQVNHSRGSIDMTAMNMNNGNGASGHVPMRTPSMLHNTRHLNNVDHNDDMLASSSVARDAAGSAHNGAFGLTRHASRSGQRRPSFDRVPSARDINVISTRGVRGNSIGSENGDNDGPAAVMALDISQPASEMNTVRTMTGTAADDTGGLLSGRGAIGSEAGGSFLSSPVGSINVAFPTSHNNTTVSQNHGPPIIMVPTNGGGNELYNPNSITSAAAMALSGASVTASGSTSKIAPLGNNRLNASAQRYAMNSSRNHEPSTSGSTGRGGAGQTNAGVAGSVTTNHLRPAILTVGVSMDDEGRPMRTPVGGTMGDDGGAEPSHTSLNEPAAMVVDDDEDSATRERKKNELQAIGPADLPNLAQIVHKFNNSLRLFRYLLILGGLHQRTSACYRGYLKLILWLCAAVCIGNMGFRTTGYRNPLFDLVLIGLHLWVATSYHLWEHYLGTRHWKGLMQIVSQHRHEQFSKRINLIGILALIGVPAASAAIYTGWIVPIVQSMIADYHSYESTAHYAFLWVHGVVMIILIVPWVAVTLCSVFLFHLVGLAHKTDIDSYYSFLMAHFTRAGTSAEQYTIAMKKHKPLRDRLNATCSYFGLLYPTFVLLAFMLVLSAAWDFNLLVINGHRGGGPGHVNAWQLIQDLFYGGLGIVALLCGLWSSASITNYWFKFTERMNDCGHKIMIVSHPMHQALIAYFNNSNTAYHVFGVVVSPTSSIQLTFAFVQLTAVALIVLNFSEMSS